MSHQENACQTIYRLSTRGKTLADEREALAETHRKLRREIANGKVAGKGQAWIDSKVAKLSRVALAWVFVENLINQGKTTRNRAQGSDNGLGAKNFLHFSN